MAGLTSAGAAGVHFLVMPEHFEESWLYGVFFLVTATAQLGYAALILRRPSRPLFAAGLAGAVMILALWLVTRLVEVPLGPGAGKVEAFSGLDILASSFEFVFLIACAGLVTAGAFACRRPEVKLRLSPVHAVPVMGIAALIAVTGVLTPPS